MPTDALYWCDGKRNLAEVIHLTQMELGPTEFDFVGYFRFLRAHGYVEFVREKGRDFNPPYTHRSNHEIMRS